MSAWPGWTDFGMRVLGARLAKSTTPAVELLVAGAVLGPACMLELIAAHHDHIEGCIGDLDAVLVPGLASVRTDSGALLLRLLGRHAPAAAVDTLQSRVAEGRQEFHALQAERAGVEALDVLFHSLVTLPGSAGQA
jgi:hypothetical protein